MEKRSEKRTKNKKKGDISAAVIVSILLLIVGFGILLTFILRIYSSDIVDREVCKESVVLRGISGGATPSGLGANFVNLRCKTQKICVTSGLIGGKCEENFPQQTVLKKKVKSESAIEKLIADEILACWDMMGQGRLTLFTPGWKAQFGIGTSDVYSSCVICSRIAFDEETLKSKGINLSKVDVYKYMLTHKVPGKDFSYAQYIAGGSPAGVSVMGKEKMKELSNSFKEDIEKQQIEGKNIELVDITEVEQQPLTKKSGEIAVIFMEISTPSGKNVIENTLVAIGGGAAIVSFLPGSGLVLKVASKALANPYVAFAVAVGVVGFVGYQTWNVYQNYNTAFSYCSDTKFENEEGYYGCRALRVIVYDEESIKQFCNIIESIS
ncbi:MAG: hypothetical protein QXF25_01645 [Candidatus Pacearchaeota archaeon]